MIFSPPTDRRAGSNAEPLRIYRAIVAARRANRRRIDELEYAGCIGSRTAQLDPKRVVQIFIPLNAIRDPGNSIEADQIRTIRSRVCATTRVIHPEIQSCGDAPPARRCIASLDRDSIGSRRNLRSRLPFMNELLMFEHLIHARSKAVFEYFGLPFDAPG